MQAQVEASDYQAQATGLKKRLAERTNEVIRLKAAIRAISSAWKDGRPLGLDRGTRDAIEAAERLVDEIERGVTR